jgi:hypothetical protein
VLAPFDGVEVHALLHELPQRAQLAEEGYALLHGLEYVVDLGVSGETADTETDTGVCALVAVTESTEDVGWLKRGRCASRAGRQGNVLESHQERFTLDIGEGNVDAARVVLGGVSVEGGVLHCEETVGQTLGELGNALGIVLVVMLASAPRNDQN